jgi:hypothetical protein
MKILSDGTGRLFNGRGVGSELSVFVCLHGSILVTAETQGVPSSTAVSSTRTTAHALDVLEM